MYTQAAAALMLVAIAATSQFAQGPGGPPGPMDPATMIQMRVANLTTNLSLTQAQQTKAAEIYTSSATASETIRTSQQSTRQAIQDAVKKNDLNTIESLSLTSGNLSGQLTAIEGKADAAFYAILTADQQAKYDSLPRGGPGGMGPAGFGPARNRASRQQ